MCYKASLFKEEKFIEEKTGRDFAIQLEYQPQYHINGFGKGNLHIITQEEPDVIYPADWGLIPKFAFKDADSFKKKYNTLNARSESVFKSNTFKESAQNQRCLILVDGFFEPHHYKGKSQPYYCYLQGKPLFAFAGIYTALDDQLFSTALITVPANELFEKVHNKKKRMPLVLDNTFTESWIDHDNNQKHIEELMRVGFTSQEIKVYPVSNDLYQHNKETNTADILEPVPHIDPEMDKSRPSLFD
jgi:putative SOS response-associated peptidase YedK